MDTIPWDDERLDDVERSARNCPSGDACRHDVLALVAEVRRLRARSSPTNGIYIVNVPEDEIGENSRGYDAE